MSDEMIKWKTDGTILYQQLPKEMIEHWKIVTPLREITKDILKQPTTYTTWKENK